MKKTVLWSFPLFAAVIMAAGCSGPKGLPDLDL
jgi:hypothetical protein